MEDKAEQYFKDGGDFFKHGHYSKAIASLDKAIVINPNFTDALYGCGLALGALGRWTEAVTSFDKVIDIKINYPRVWFAYGYALGKLKRYAEAVASYDRAIAIDPNDAEAKQNRKIALKKLT